MHPAYSVILFTTLSGAGYGLLVWLAYSVLVAEIVPVRTGPAIIAFGLAFGLISAGLLASTLHLGRPERAWRAFSQWRSSWLSREGVLAVATYPVAGLFALMWLVNPASPWFGVLAMLSAILALATVFCTGMIYASLPTIRAWTMPQVVPIYLVLALVTGGALASALGAALTGKVPGSVILIELLLVGIAFMLKSSYWSAVDDAPPLATSGTATGLGRMGRVRSLDPPHSRPNYVMREMGYEIARKHALKLRAILQIALFAVPAVCFVLALLAGGSWSIAPLVLAVASVGLGVVIERWLFFAEAEHVVMVFYGKQSA